jgi:hypothetical protein
MGDRVSKGPGVGGGFDPRTRPYGTPRTTEAGQVSGRERQAKCPERGRVAVLAEHSTEEGGELRPKGPTGGKATPGITLRRTDRRERP